MSELTIPFNRPGAVGDELRYIEEALRCQHLSGDGDFTKRCQLLLERELGTGRALLTTSCTHALELAALLIDLGPGDEFVVPSFAFPSTANAFVLRGAKPIFADIRPDTLNLDEARLEPLLGPRTRAIVVVHYAGIACEMDPILDLASRRGIPVVEDNAHGLFGSYRGRALGTLGALASLSFHETKNISCGEGGALIVNEAQYLERAEVLREKGTDRSRFFRGEVDKYSWIDVGSSYVPSDLLAAFLLAQLEARERIQAARRNVWERYRKGLGSWAESAGARLPECPPHMRNPAHLFYLLMPTGDARDALIAHLKTCGVTALFHYLPLHSSRMGRSFGGGESRCPVTEDASARLLRLPLFFGMSEAEVEHVIDAVRRFRRP